MPPVLDRFPATVAVSGVPEAAVNVPVMVHPASAASFQPPFRIMPCTPTGEDSTIVIELHAVTLVDTGKTALQTPVVDELDGGPPGAGEAGRIVDGLRIRVEHRGRHARA